MVNQFSASGVVGTVRWDALKLLNDPSMQAMKMSEKTLTTTDNHSNLSAVSIRWSITATSTPCLEKTSRLWLAISLTHVNNFDIFSAEMLPIKYTIKRHFTMPHQITCASALPSKLGKRENAFPLNAVLVRCLNSSSCLISSMFLTHDSYSRCCMTPQVL